MLKGIGIAVFHRKCNIKLYKRATPLEMVMRSEDFHLRSLDPRTSMLIPDWLGVFVV
jgi:hypothetical protein